MGDGKRKSPELDGAGGADRTGIVSGDGEAGRADAVTRLEGATQKGIGKRKSPEVDGAGGGDRTGIVSGDGEAGRADAVTRMAQKGISGGGADADTRMEAQKGISSGGADEGRNRSIYLVACHSDWVSKPYIVYKMDVAPTATGASSPSPVIPQRLKRSARLKCYGEGKTFISVRPTHRAWIIGVGGTYGDTVIFDTKTLKVIRGPDLKSPKWSPILSTVGDKVYALARCPSWKVMENPDFPPWFEVLDLEGAKVVKHEGREHLEGCSWKPLAFPPCLPWKLSPTDYTMLPITVARSYVVVNPYILVSFNQPWGTYAFDTNLDEWHKVDNKELPFVGCASPFGSLFLGMSQHQQKRDINAYCISVKTSDKDQAPKLSITALPVKYEGQELGTDPCFHSLENGCFCLLSFSLDRNSVSLHYKKGEYFLRKACVNLRTYRMENISLLEASEEMLQAMKPVIVFSNQGEQAFTISSLRHGFSQGFTFLSL